MTCKCFTCTHKDPRLKKAYCIGYMEACEWFLNWAKEQGIKMGSISDNDLGGIYAQINCNYQETGCYARELPDIDEVPRKTTGKIEKLPEFDRTEASIFHAERLYSVVNELVDAVNELKAKLALPTLNPDLTEEDLRKMMCDPKYWRDKDSATIQKVQDGFNKLYGDKN